MKASKNKLVSFDEGFLTIFLPALAVDFFVAFFLVVAFDAFLTGFFAVVFFADTFL